MKVTVVSCFFFVSVIVALSSQPSIQVNGAKSSITPNQKAQIENGLKAAASLMKFLVEKDFFSTLTKISSVAGPVFMVASVVLNIVFLFIDIESPEMALMKKEFANLNNRLDKWSTEFDDIKRKIDWSAIQMSYGDYERSIKALHSDLNQIVNSPSGMRDTQKQIFINKYESSFLNTAEKLYDGLINTDSVFSQNLFLASQRYTQYHRTEVQNFMMGIFQLLLQGIQVQATYVTLKYNSTAASDFVEKLWTKKLSILQNKMQEVDTATKNQWQNQYQIDLDILLKQHNGKSNKQFTDIAGNHFFNKYNWRNWLIITYNQLSGFNDHAVSECQGTHRFRSYGRNFMISSKDKSAYQMAGAQQKGDNLLTQYHNRDVSEGNNRALRIVNDLRSYTSKSCNEFYHISAIKWGGGVWYWRNGGVLAYRKVCMRGNNCFNTYMFG